jgi:serine/threonine-protein kinase SRPK3
MTDLTPSNIVFSLPDIQSMPPYAVCQLLGPIIKEKVKLHDGSYSSHSPRRMIKNPDFSGFNIGMTSAAVMIIDFGEAFLSENPRRTGLGVPITSFPPEVLFRCPPSVSSDIWQLACLFCKIFYQRPLFPLYFPIFEMLIGQIVHFVGLLPHSWQGHFNAEKYGYMDGGEVHATPEGAHFWFHADPQDQRGSLREELLQAASRAELTTEQQDFIVPLLQEMLVREPEGRLPARDALRRLEFAAPLFGGEVAEHPEQIPELPDDAPPPPPPPPPESDDSDIE